ncbi:MAG: arsenate reductase ArsC [Desulfobacterales bacterium]|nr:arsenate reductase ArsC [Desulfobacterales bacterium]
MEEKIRVLFICIHNSARSQMAEEFLKNIGRNRFIVESAGFEPTEVNPLVVEVMKEEGIDLANNKAKSLFKFFKEGRLYDYVITVCDDSTEKECPVFAGIAKRLHWPFPDPSALLGRNEEKKKEIRKIRDKIKSKIQSWVKELNG